MGKLQDGLGMVRDGEERAHHHHLLHHHHQKNRGETGELFQHGLDMVNQQAAKEEEEEEEEEVVVVVEAEKDSGFVVEKEKAREIEKEKEREREAGIGVENEVPRVLLAVAATLERLVLRNERCIRDLSSHRKLTIYHGLRAPSISIRRYLERINRYSSCSPSCFVVGFIYIDQLLHKRPHVPLISLNVHRLLITSIMLATKLLDDVHYNNSFYARVGGISNAELNSLELDLLFQLDFRLQVSGHVFEGYCSHLEREMVLSEQRIGVSIRKDVENDDSENREKPKRLAVDARRRVQPLMSPGSALLDP